MFPKGNVKSFFVVSLAVAKKILSIIHTTSSDFDIIKRSISMLMAPHFFIIYLVVLLKHNFGNVIFITCLNHKYVILKNCDLYIRVKYFRNSTNHNRSSTMNMIKS